MKILLINANRKEKQGHIYFPLGLGYIAAQLINTRHEISFCDLQDLSLNDIKDRISEYDFDIIGISALITDFKFVQWFSAYLKKNYPFVPIILGAGLSTIPQLILEKSNIDIVVYQEGEETINELVRALEEKRDLGYVKGIFYRNSGKIIDTSPRALIEDLDAIPFPAYDVFKVSKYLQTDKLGFNYPIKSLSLITSRGCPYECVFCDKGIWGKRYRTRSAGNVIDEIKFLKKKYDIDAVVFSDDLFVLDKKRVYEFCDQLIREKIDIAWSCNGRVNIMDESLLRKMKRAGCTTIGYGFESGSQRMLDAMKKGTTVEQAKRVIELTRKVGLDLHPYLVLGMVGEDEDSVQETIEFCKEMGLPVGKFGIFTPLPNTKLYEIAEKMGRLQSLEIQIDKWQNWTEIIAANLSNMSNDKLLELKKKAESEIRNHYVKYHLWIILKRFLLRYNRWGIKVAFATLLNWLKKYLKYQRKQQNEKRQLQNSVSSKATTH